MKHGHKLLLSPIALALLGGRDSPASKKQIYAPH